MMDDTENRLNEFAAGSGGPGDRPAPPHLDVDQLNAYLDDALDPEARAEASAHLAGCAACRQDLTELRATVDLLHALPQYRPRRSFQLTPEQALPAERGWLTRLLPVMPALRAATIAVAIALMAVVAGDIFSNGNGNRDNGNVARAPSQLASPGAAARPGATDAGAGTEPTISAFSEMQTPTAAPTSEPRLPAPPAAPTVPPVATEEVLASDEFAGDTALAPAEDATGGESDMEGGQAGAGEEAAEEPTDVDEEPQPESPEPEAAIGAAAPAEADTESIESMAVADAPGAVPPTPEPTEAKRQASTPVASPPASPVATPVATPIASPVGSPVSKPTTAVSSSSSDATPAAQESIGEKGGGVSGWRVAEVGLVMILAWLLVSMVGLDRLRRQRDQG